MFGLSFSRLPKHRKFSYSPIYYDEQAEELKTRVENIKREMGETVSTQKSAETNIRNAYQSRKSADRFSALPSQKFYGFRVIVIALVLGFAFYKFLNSNLIEIIFGHLNK